MNKIKISVIVPVYNSEKFIKKCLESILNQTLKEIEVIVINDGSLDKSLSIIKKFCDSDNRIRVIDKKNEGVSQARNDGINLSKGKYLAMIDSDDYIELNYLEESYKRLENDKLDILITDIIFKGKNQTKVIKDLKILDEEIITGQEYLRIFLEDNFFGFNCNKIIKRDNFIKNNIKYDKNIMMMEDVLVLIQLALNSKRIGKINKVYYNYLQHSENTTKEIKISHLESVELVLKEAKKYLAGDLYEILATRFFYIKLEYIIAIKKIDLRKIKLFIKNESKIKINLNYSLKIKVIGYFYSNIPMKYLYIKFLRLIYKVYFFIRHN